MRKIFTPVAGLLLLSLGCGSSKEPGESMVDRRPTDGAPKAETKSTFADRSADDDVAKQTKGGETIARKIVYKADVKVIVDSLDHAEVQFRELVGRLKG